MRYRLLFVGSMIADLAGTSAEALQLMARSCGRHLSVLPGGELEDNAGWAADRLEEFAELPVVRTVKKCRIKALSYLGVPVYRCVSSTLSTWLGLAFLAPNVRSMPSRWQRGAKLTRLSIWRKVKNVILQIDTPVSNIAANCLAGNKDVIAGLARMLQDLVAGFPSGVETGVHLCAGRYGARPFGPALLYGMRPMAKLTLAIGQHVPNLHYIHAPVIAGMHRPRKPGSFYQGLELLRELPGSMGPYLGMVHPDEPLMDGAMPQPATRRRHRWAIT